MSVATSSAGAATHPLNLSGNDRRAWLRGAGWAVVVCSIAAAIGLMEPEHLAIASIGVLVTTCIVIRPLAAVLLLIPVVPFGSLVPLGSEDMSLSVTEPLVALLALAWAAACVRERRLSLAGGPIIASVLGLAALAAYSITYATSPPLALKETLKWIELLIVAWVVVDLANSRRAVTWLLATLFVSVTAEALWGIAQAATESGPAAFLVGGALRAFGTFDQPNPFAGYLSMVLPMAVLVALHRSASLAVRRLAGVTAVAAAGGILLSQSRGALLGLGLAFFVLLLIWSRRTRQLLAPLIATSAAVVLMAFAGLIPDAAIGRLSQTVEYFGVFDVQTVEVTDENWAVVERMAHWQAAWLMFADRPWLGVGAGNYPDAYPDYFVDDWSEPLGHAHNYYLNTLAELGVVGLTLLLAFLVLFFRTLAQTYRAAAASRGPEHAFWRVALAGVLGALLVFCTHNLFDNLFVHSVNVQLGLFLGIMLVAARHVPGPQAVAGLQRAA